MHSPLISHPTPSLSAPTSSLEPVNALDPNPNDKTESKNDTVSRVRWGG
jgi:hypothetical protein